MNKAEKNGAVSQPDEGERWGCLVQDRASRFVVAWATGALSEALIEQVGTTTLQRTHQRELRGKLRDVGSTEISPDETPTRNIAGESVTLDV